MWKNSLNGKIIAFDIIIAKNYLAKEKLKALDKNTEYYLVCEHGNKSKLVSEILNKQGFKTYNIIGGIKEYQKIINKE